jgi:ligand-binding sensor domain-containing protein
MDRSKFIFVIPIVFISIFWGCDKAVSVSPPDKPPPNGTVFINSYPKGAIIYLNGKAQRRITPDSITWLMTGTDTITLKRDYFRDTIFTVNAAEGEKHTYFIDYSKDPLMLGKISCASLPTNGSIFINDSSTGLTTPATIKNLLPGRYNVTYKFKNHEDKNLNILVQSNTTSSGYGILVDTTLWMYYNTDDSPIVTDNLNCIAMDDNYNKLWIGTQGYGLVIYDGIKWLNYRALGGNTIPNDSVLSIAASEDNQIWAGTSSGIADYFADGPNNAYVYLKTAVRAVSASINTIAASDSTHIDIFWPAGSNSLYPTSSNSQDYYITAIAFDKKNNIWVGTENRGLAYGYLDWNYVTSSASAILSNRISAMASDNSGNIYVGYPAGAALANGISSYNGSSWQTYYILPNGASTDCIYVDPLNRMWVGTNNGLVEKDEENINTFNYDNTGLNITNVSGVTEDKYGNVWITTYDAGLLKYKGAK